jgi:hypothetical protein
MFKIRRTAAVAAGAVVALAVGGTAALAAGADDPAPSPSATDDRGGSVRLLPDGDPVPTASSDDSASPSPSASRPTSPPAAVPPATSALSISLARAEAIARRVAGGGRVTKAESETEHGRPIWKIRVVAGGVQHDVYVDKVSGAVVRDRTRSASASSTGSSARHDAGDDKGGLRSGGSDDSASHDKNDDKGGASDGHGSDDHGGDDHGSGGHGSDD